ncbi:hypothetical protein [Actinokineospora iranica]|uniref:Uncharacterized protein n=1 Tax=Actinokineospora iranica TaxID=1271860 RepID=A0A1G6WRA3_9PSEU|nr:hypothetical protein [Actinokineospora iranica]SDD68398.1 hypothetical protein SAMN05216174_115136 [Actinokineospora iranica]
MVSTEGFTHSATPDTTVSGLLVALARHLDTHRELPELTSATVVRYATPSRVQAQLDSDTRLPKVAAGLLSWAGTLAEAAAFAWRTDYSTHLEVTGRLPEGAEVLVYTGVDTGVLPDLAVGARVPLPWATLHAWAALPASSRGGAA